MSSFIFLITIHTLIIFCFKIIRLTYLTLFIIFYSFIKIYTTWWYFIIFFPFFYTPFFFRNISKIFNAFFTIELIIWISFTFTTKINFFRTGKALTFSILKITIFTFVTIELTLLRWYSHPSEELQPGLPWYLSSHR